MDIKEVTFELPYLMRYLFMGYSTVNARSDPVSRFGSLSVYDDEMNQIINVSGKDIRNASF